MKKISLLLMALTIGLSVSTAQARNTPCSGKKGGVSHCIGKKFMCKNGTVSKSKKTCIGGKRVLAEDWYIN